MDELCTDDSDVLFTESRDNSKPTTTSRSKSVGPSRDAPETTSTTQEPLPRSNSTSPLRRRPAREPSVERKPISGVLTMKPTNLEKEMDTFFASAYKAAPQFTYAKSESCIKEAFSENSNVCFELLPEAERILARVKTEYGSSEAFFERLYGDEKTDPDELREKILQYLKDHNMLDRVKVRIVENGLSAASVNKAYCPKRGRHFYTVNIAKVPFSSNMIQGTCDHEIGTHLIRMRNDEMQVWHGARDKFKLGNPWVTEEGFATLNTYQSMPCKLLFPQALRYYAVCRGATLGFAELFHELQSYVDNPKLNWQMCCRVKRGLFDTSQPGAFNMDQAYFKGAVEILRHFSEIDLVQLYSGQVALQDLDKIKFLHRREEVVLPWFLNCPEALETYKEHCHELIHENQIACATGRKPTFFRAAADLLKRIPRWTKATPAFLQRKVQGSPANKTSRLDSPTKKSAVEQDHVIVREKAPKPEAFEKTDQTQYSEEHKSKKVCPTKVQNLIVGRYKITYEGIRVGPEAELGHAPITHLPKGTEVNVLEVVQVEHRIRARIDQPDGWISLMNTDSGFLWATLESILVSSDNVENLQDGDQKQDNQSQEDLQPSEAPALDNQPQEEFHSKKQGRSEEQPIQVACDIARLEEPCVVLQECEPSKDLAENKHSPQPQDGMLEIEANQDEAGKVHSDLSTAGNACVSKIAAKVANASLVSDELTGPRGQIDALPKNDASSASSSLAVVENSSSIAAEIVADDLENIGNRSSNDASHRDVEDATASTAPVALKKPLKTGDTSPKSEKVNDLSLAVQDLADAVKEWKRLKAEFDENVPCEVAKPVDEVAKPLDVESTEESAEARFLRRWSRRSSSKTVQDVVPGGRRVSTDSVIEEKAVDRKPRQRYKRKNRRAASKRNASLDATC